VTCSAQGYDFTFAAGGFGISDDGNPNFNRNTSSGLAAAAFSGNGAPPVTITMSRTGGGVFDLGSFDAATGFADFTGPYMASVIGSISGGGTVTQDISISVDWSNFVLTGFTNLTQVVFSNADEAGISIDNLNTDVAAAAVPEPASILLMGLGFAGFAASRRKTGK
jgi:hypothetical protein